MLQENTEIRLLLIEDDNDSQFLLVKKLEELHHLNFDIIFNKTLKEALVSIKEKKHYDLIFLDLNLPDSKGIDTLVAITTATPNIPIIVLTALDEKAFGVLAMQHGAQDFFVKGDYTAANLEKAILYAIERNRIRKILTPYQQEHIRLLIIEDDADYRFLLIEKLKRIKYSNFEFIEASNLNEALILLASQKVNVIFLDLNLPDSKQLATLLALKDYSSKIPVIAMTGIETDDLGLHAMKHGAQDFFIKQHFDEKMLEKSIMYAIERSHMTQLILSQESNKYQQLFENCGDCIIIHTLNGKIIDVNQKTCKLLEMPKHAIINKNIIDFQKEEDHQKTIRDFKELAKKKELQIESYLLDSHQIAVQIEIKATYLSQHDGEPLVQAMVRDITGRKKREVELAELYKEMQDLHIELNQIFNAGPPMAILSTEEKRILRVNQTFCDLFNVKREKLLRATINDVITPQKFKKINENNEEGSYELKQKTDTGEGNNFLVKIMDYKTAEGQIIGTIETYFDITNLKKAQQEALHLDRQLQQARKIESIGTLAAGIAHEINTPIQFINDNTSFVDDAVNDLLNAFDTIKQLLMENQTLSEQLQEVEKKLDMEFLKEEIPKALEQSKEGLATVNKIVKAMRDFSHVPIIDPKIDADINAALESTIMISKNEWKYDADLETDFDTALPAVSCYIGDIKQVFLNLIVNAAHAIKEKNTASKTSKKGLIKICTFVKNHHVVITVSDSGCGIADIHKDKVFDHFFTTKGVGKGSGQGLSLAYSCIIEKHGGMISFDSKKNEGTTFKIELPLKKGADNQHDRASN